MILKFSDGIEIDLSGPVRILELQDGFYVVGEGMLKPVSSREEAEQIVGLHKIMSSPLVRKQIVEEIYPLN
jgi:hypothetical protein